MLPVANTFKCACRCRSTTIGHTYARGVVIPAQALLVIVLQAEQLEAEAILENKDIGFVNAGQSAAIKVETFNYTKYGLLDGMVKNISLDAISDEKRGFTNNLESNVII